ncbi:MAG TPA: hypothetical protein VJZ99_01200, partial [Patescibacteria group bacterium]|nr:hypothetical protein [Patescibacteria group bacterium]
SKYALARYKLALRKYKFEAFANKLKNLFRSKAKRVKFDKEKPILMTSIPLLMGWRKVRVKGKLFKKRIPIISNEIDLEVLLLRKRLPEYSIVYISDINRFINQWSYKNINIQENVSEFISEFRHYTKGGYFIANSQASSQVAKEIRNTFGKVRNLLSFKRFLFFFYKIEGRTITLSEDVLSVEQGDADKKNINSTNIYGFLNPFIYRYDTYAYYGRITEMEFTRSKNYITTNTNYFFDLPNYKIESLTINELKEYRKYFSINYKKMILIFFHFLVFGLLLSLLFKSGILLILFMFLFGLIYYDALS